MATRPVPDRWTYEEFARVRAPEGHRVEIIAGELYVSPSPVPAHQRVVMRLLAALHAFAIEHDLGEVFPGPIDVLFAEGDYLVPDLVFVRKERAGIVSGRGLEAAPDLVVEVLSPSTAKRDRELKRERYLLYGVPEYWVVDGAGRRIEVHRPGGSERIEAPSSLRWSPVPGGSALEVELEGLFG